MYSTSRNILFICFFPEDNARPWLRTSALTLSIRNSSPVTVEDVDELIPILMVMELSSVWGNGFQPVFCFIATRPRKNFKPVNATKFATPPPPPQRVATQISRNGTEKNSEVSSNPVNVNRYITKRLPGSRKTRGSAILDLQYSPELASALLRFCFLLCFSFTNSLQCIAFGYPNLYLIVGIRC